MIYEDAVISGFVGYHEIKIEGNVLKRVNNSLYLGFDSEQDTIGPKKKYGEFGTFYDIANLAYVGGDDQLSIITVYPLLEESLKLNRKIMFYDKETPSFWFGLDIPVESFKNTTFYIKAYDEARNIVRYPPISQLPPYLTFFADPIAPLVVKHYPRDGSTSKATMPVGITVKEGKQESGLFNRSVNITINNRAVSVNIENDAELEAQDPSSNYYRIYYPAYELDNGVYDVSVTGYDLAMNAFDESTVTSRWTFIVDRNLPADPYFSLIGGFSDNTGARWYSRTSPDFVIDFSDERNPVTIVDVMMEDSPTEGGAANCINTSFNVFRCTFTTPKTTTGMFWADYGVIIDAYKTLDDDTNSNIGHYGPFAFTVDDQAPDFLPAFKNRFMDKINLTVGAIVSNENHPLHADIEVRGAHYAPLFSSNNGTFYYFVWGVPRYYKDRGEEGATSMVITLADFAQNKRSITVPIYIDLTAPRLENITMNISKTIQIGKELFTAQPNVTVSGDFIDDDIESVWIVPGDFNETVKALDGKKNADIKREGSVPKSFSVSVRLIDPGAGKVAKAPMLYNYMLISQINNMTLYAKDIAGHISAKRLRVISDLAAPSSPTFCLGESWSSCMPGSGPELTGSAEIGTSTQSKVEVCHDGNTLSIAQSAVQAHLDHGDYLGVCTD